MKLCEKVKKACKEQPCSSLKALRSADTVVAGGGEKKFPKERGLKREKFKKNSTQGEREYFQEAKGDSLQVRNYLHT